jgi:hypothetical protein
VRRNAWSDEAGLIGKRDELRAVAATELAEDPADVRLRRQRTDHQPARDFVVGEAGGDKAEDLLLAVREVAELVRNLTWIRPFGEFGDQPSGDRGREESFSCGNDPDCL